MPSSERVEAKVVDARCKEVAEEFMTRVSLNNCKDALVNRGGWSADRH